MHKTEAGERRKTLKREAQELVRDAKVLQKAAKTLPEARQEGQRLQEEADRALAESEALKLQARLEDLTVWEMEKTKSTKKGTKSLTGDKLSNFSPASPKNRYQTQANSRHCLWKLRKLSPVNP